MNIFTKHSHSSTDRFTSTFCSCHLDTGGGFSMCWCRAYKCQSLPGHLRQVSKDSSVSLPLDSIWNCVCLCVYVCPCGNVLKYWEMLHSQQSLFGSNCPVHNRRQGFSNFLMQVPQIWSPCERKYKLFLKYIGSYIKIKYDFKNNTIISLFPKIK